MQRQAMGVALHIVLLPFFELLHSTIDSYDADLIVGFFLPAVPQLTTLKGSTKKPGGRDEHATRAAIDEYTPVRSGTYRPNADARSHPASSTYAGPTA